MEYLFLEIPHAKKSWGVAEFAKMRDLGYIRGFP